MLQTVSGKTSRNENPMFKMFSTMALFGLLNSLGGSLGRVRLNLKSRSPSQCTMETLASGNYQLTYDGSNQSSCANVRSSDIAGTDRFAPLKAAAATSAR
jgi:hypothetical protein